jgi:hypothetical protein
MQSRNAVIEWSHKEDHLTDQLLQDYGKICLGVVEEMRRPGAFTFRGVSFDAEGKSAALDEAVSHDVLGWIFVVGKRVLGNSPNSDSKCMRASIGINDRVYTLTGRSIVDINDNYHGEDVTRISDEKLGAMLATARGITINAVLAAAESFGKELVGRQAKSERIRAWEGNRLVG